MARTYTSAVRRQRAEQTRARVLDAARDLFATQGYTVTSVREIAERAGVAIQTVRANGTKAELMAAVLEREMVGAEGARFSEQQEVIAIFADPDNDSALRRYTRFMATSHARIAQLWHTALVAGDADPQIAAALDRSEQSRRCEIEAGSQVFVVRGLIAPERRERFVEALTQLTDPEAYHYFVIRRGWSQEEYADWLLEGILGHR